MTGRRIAVVVAAVVVVAGAVGAALLLGSDGDPVAPADPVAAVDAALVGSGLAWSGEEELVLMPHCSEVDAVVGWALTVQLAHPDDWSPPARDDWARVGVAGSDAGSDLDTTPRGTWLVDGEVTVDVSGGTARVSVELADGAVERLRKHPRVGEPEFMCG